MCFLEHYSETSLYYVKRIKKERKKMGKKHGVGCCCKQSNIYRQRNSVVYCDIVLKMLHVAVPSWICTLIYEKQVYVENKISEVIEFSFEKKERKIYKNLNQIKTICNAPCNACNCEKHPRFQGFFVTAKKYEKRNFSICYFRFV